MRDLWSRRHEEKPNEITIEVAGWAPIKNETASLLAANYARLGPGV